MKMLEYIVRIMTFLIATIFIFGLYDKWVNDREFDLEDIFVLLFITMLYIFAIGDVK